MVQHAVEDEVEFLEFIAQGMGHVDLPWRFDGCGQAGAVVRRIAAEQGRHVWSQLGVSEAGRQCQKQAKRREKGHDSGLAEFEARGFLTVGGDGRLQEPLQALLTETAVLTGPFDLQQPMVDVPSALTHEAGNPMVAGFFEGSGKKFFAKNR